MECLEEYALKNNVPIMQKDGINFLCDYIKKHQVKKILELGTAIGYSAINMAKIDSNIKITTIERNSDMYKIALENIKKYGLLENYRFTYKPVSDLIKEAKGVVRK